MPYVFIENILRIWRWDGVQGIRGCGFEEFLCPLSSVAAKASWKKKCFDASYWVATFAVFNPRNNVKKEKTITHEKYVMLNYGVTDSENCTVV